MCLFKQVCVAVCEFISGHIYVVMEQVIFNCDPDVVSKGFSMWLINMSRIQVSLLFVSCLKIKWEVVTYNLPIGDDLGLNLSCILTPSTLAVLICSILTTSVRSSRREKGSILSCVCQGLF